MFIMLKRVQRLRLHLISSPRLEDEERLATVSAATTAAIANHRRNDNSRLEEELG
jgi:hypothetical protein